MAIGFAVRAVPRFLHQTITPVTLNTMTANPNPVATTR